MNKYETPKHHIRFPEQLQGYLERAGNAEFNFRAYPISRNRETFHYNKEKGSYQGKDGRAFDSLDDFICYAFQ